MSLGCILITCVCQYTLCIVNSCISAFVLLHWPWSCTLANNFIMYVCMYVCMYAHTCTHTNTWAATSYLWRIELPLRSSHSSELYILVHVQSMKSLFAFISSHRTILPNYLYSSTRYVLDVSQWVKSNACIQGSSCSPHINRILLIFCLQSRPQINLVKSDWAVPRPKIWMLNEFYCMIIIYIV